MKKLTALILALLMAASLSLFVSANADGNKWGDIPLYNGEIVLDGEIDDIYFEGLAVDINKRTNDLKGGSTGTAYFLWGNNKLYMAVDVTDPEIVPVDPSKSTYQNEAIEYTIDFKNNGDTKNTCKVMVSAEDNRMEYRYEAKEGYAQSACTMSDDGFIIEVIVDLTKQSFSTPKAGENYGLTIVIDDITGKDTRATINPVHKNGASGANDVKKFDYITLGANEVKIVEEAPATTEAPATATKAPATADLGVLAVIAIATAFGGAVVSKKRR